MAQVLQAARDRPGVCALLVAVMACGGFALDGVNTASTQALFGLCAFAALAAVLSTVPPAVRWQACLLGVLATITEVLFSAAWGMYEYRLENIPSFVPAGHALVFACTWRLATRDGREPGRAPSAALWAGAAAAPLVLLARHPDDGFGLLCLTGWWVLVALLPAHRAFLCWMAIAVVVVEGTGTAVGAWTWVDAAPGTGLSMGNPPSGIAACYCVLDLLAIGAVTRLRRGREPAPRPVPAAA